MPQVQVLGLPRKPTQRRRLARAFTDAMVTRYAATAADCSVKFVDFPPEKIAHAGRLLSEQPQSEAGIRLFVAVYGLPRPIALRRQLAQAFADAAHRLYDVKKPLVTMYVFDVPRSNASQAGRLASDVARAAAQARRKRPARSPAKRR